MHEGYVSWMAEVGDEVQAHGWLLDRKKQPQGFWTFEPGERVANPRVAPRGFVDTPPVEWGDGLIGYGRVPYDGDESVLAMWRWEADASESSLAIPDGGFSMSLPTGWDSLGVLRAEGAWTEMFGPDVTEWYGLGAMAPARPGQSPEGCSIRVFRPTMLTGAEYIERGFSALGVASPRAEVIDEHMARIAGPATELGGDEDVFQAVYALNENEALAVLDCQATEAPEDLWLSMAETMALLPASGDSGAHELTAEATAAPTPLEDG
jgi:hypothetical protein